MHFIHAHTRTPFVFALAVGCVLYPASQAFLAAQPFRARSVPDELHFSDASSSDPAEERLAEKLANGAVAERVAAAEALWLGHRLKYVHEVLKFVSGPSPGGDDFAALRRYVEKKSTPAEILWQLQKNDYPWGAWLAFHRPHRDLTPALLAGLKDKPAFLPETILALGNSRDHRALAPLLERLKDDDYVIAGYAAQALGYLGDAAAEPSLLDALAKREDGWVKLKASRALAKIGSRRALPALEKLSNDQRYAGGVLMVNAAARAAIESIVEREKR